MSKKIILLSSAILGINILSGTGLKQAKAESIGTGSSIELMNEMPDAVVRSKWVERFLREFPAPYAPKLYYYDYGGFAGYLSLIHEDKQMGGTTGTYQGFIYNKKYPIPSPAKLPTEKNNQIETVAVINSSSKVIYKYKTDFFFSLPTVLNYDDGSYRGKLYPIEYWANKDGTYTATYSGTVYKGARPIPSAIPEDIEVDW